MVLLGTKDAMHDSPAPSGLQPHIHDGVVALRAPTQAWSRADGTMGDGPIDGVYHSDVRVVDRMRVLVDGRPGEHIATLVDDASTVRFIALHRELEDRETADPDIRSTLTRSVGPDGVTHAFEIDSRLGRPLEVEIAIELRADLSPMDAVKGGRAVSTAPRMAIEEPASIRWHDDAVRVVLSAPSADIELTGNGGIRIAWVLEIPARGSGIVQFTITAEDDLAVVRAATGPTPWRTPDLRDADDRLARWVARALQDLDALRMQTTLAPGHEFLAAGAPWYLTLFGRDAIWSARMLLPLGTGIALGTLRALATLQGRARVVETAEQPGKILHELRRAPLEIPDEDVTLPPRYYGTVDATPLWVTLLAETADAGAAEADIAPLLPNLEAALAWMRDYGDSDVDGLLEYVDESGHGLSNQGWKDSGDSVQWRDGALAQGPIALCEVQAYAFEAAMRGADLLERFGRDGREWREWAERLAARFRASFWIDDPDGAYPAIALDRDKRPVDTLTSNLGHLLGTGLLDERERALVAKRLVSPELDSGYGLRTMSTRSAGYWALSYHGGSVWTHDTAIAIRGLAIDGFTAEAERLAEGLIKAAVAYDYRVPELHAGDSIAHGGTPVPYPAACRPQAWSAAAAVTVLASTRPDLLPGLAR